jgi:valyl-tRNA synthetase
VLNGDDVSPALKRGARETLAAVHGALLRLLHPIVPFVTEELWLTLCARRGIESATIMLEDYPAPADFGPDADAGAEIEWLKGFIVGIRQIRGEMNLSPSRPLRVQLQGYGDRDRQRVEANRLCIDRLARIERIDWLGPEEKAPGAATALLGDMRILIPLAGLVDTGKEIERLEKQLAKLARDIEQTQKKLANERFVANAPPDVVGKERERADELDQRSMQLRRQLETLREIG